MEPPTEKSLFVHSARTTRDEEELLDLSERLSASKNGFRLSEAPADAQPPQPPAEGVRAWLFMVSAFLIEALMWGLPLTFGIFQAYYNEQQIFQNNRYIPVIGTLATGIPFLGAPVITPLTARWHKYQRQMICLIAASFATKVWHLIVTQGVAYGLGFLVIYYALLSMLNEWFVERRGLAYGLLFAAAGMSGTGLPFLIQTLLQKYGFRPTLRGYAVALLVCIGPTLPLCRGRSSYANTGTPCRRVDWGVLKSPVFWAFSASNFFQGLAVYLPGIYLPTYAATLSISPAKATLLLCLLNGSQVFGQVVLGWVSDWINVFLLLGVSTFGSALIAGLIWYMAKTFYHLLAFTLLYGLFAGGGTVLWARFITVLTQNPATSLWLYGLLACQRGVGNIAAGPISVKLFEMTKKYALASEPTAYRNLILFVAICLGISSLGAFSYCFGGRQPKRTEKEDIKLQKAIARSQQRLNHARATEDLRRKSLQHLPQPSRPVSSPQRPFESPRARV